MQTIAELKADALKREEARAQAELARQAEYAAIENARETALLDLVESRVPPELLYVADTHLTDGNDIYRIVTFRMKGHAEIQACYSYDNSAHFDETRHQWMGAWKQLGFPKDRDWEADQKRLWRVKQFDSIGYDAEAQECFIKYVSRDFAELGDALLAAERVYVPDADIQAHLDAATLRAALASPENAPAAPSPELRAEQKLIAAFDAFLHERLRQYEH